MSRKFREWQPDASWLFPPSPRDWLPEDHLVYFLMDVTAQIDISPIVTDYGGENGGQPPFHPRMMLILLLYAYSTGAIVFGTAIAARSEASLRFVFWRERN